MRAFMPFLCSILLLASWPQVTDAGLVTSPWNPAGGQAGAAFGSAVAPAGDVNGDGYSDVLVGAPLYDNGQADEGRVFLYLGSLNGLSPSPAWTFEPNQANAHLGAALAGAGDVNWDGYFDVLIAAPDYDRPGHADAGAVFVFHGTAQGLPAAPDDTLANDITGSHFGASLSYAGYTGSDSYVDVVIGAPDFSGGQANEGAAYLYLGSAKGLTAGLVFESNEAGARAGASVSGGGDVNADGFSDIVIGEPGAAPSGHPAAGRMIILPGSSNGVTTIPIATFNGAEDSLAVGAGVAIAGDVDADGYADVLLGSPGETGVGIRKGIFRCLRGTPSGLDPTPLFVINGTFDHDRAGAAVATAGDLDGDGYADFAFPDPLGFPNHAGVVNLFYGGQPGTAYGSFIGGVQANSRFGASAATAGDVDGDGFGELIVGAPDGGAGLEGKAYLFLGRPSMPSSIGSLVNDQGPTSLGSSLAILPALSPGFNATLLVGEPGYNSGAVRRYEGRIYGFTTLNWGRFNSGPGDGAFGDRVVFAGDVNRDNYPDFLVSSPLYSSDGIVERGRVYLYLGNGNDWTQSPWLAQGVQAEEFYGTAIAAGDVNGDGYSDIAIGAWSIGGQAGTVSVYLGGPSGPSSIPSWTKNSNVPFENFGYRVAILDFDADGYEDLAVSCASTNQPERVDIFYGGPGGLSNNAAFSLSPVPAVPTFGSEMAGVGDFNCDGVDDLVVTAPGHGIWFYPGSRARSKPNELMVRKWLAPDPASEAGASIAGAGDLDGDGRADFVVGAPYASHPEQQEGMLYVFRGRPGEGGIAPDTTYESDVAFRNLGSAIAPLADVNSDGFADIVAAASGGDGSISTWLGGREGALFGHFMFESSGGVRRFSPAAMDSATKYGWGQVSRSAAGRTRVSTQIEARLQGTSFTGVPTHDAYYLLDTGTPNPTGSWGGGGGYSIGFVPRASYHVRGRSYVNSPYFPHTRWVTPDALASVYDFRLGGTVTGTPGAGVEAVARLGRIAPNPARGAARIPFELPGRAAVRLDVYDVRGRHVRSLAHEPLESGVRTWDGTDTHGSRVPPGLYFVELRVGDQVDRGRIVLMN